MAEAFQETDLESDSRSETEDVPGLEDSRSETGAATLSDLERSRWEVQDGDDEEVTMMVRGPRKGDRCILPHSK